jgi:nitroreductase
MNLQNSENSENLSKNKKEYFWDILLSRRSVRSYQDKPVEDEVIKKILSSAFCAPRGSQEKSWDFVIVKSDAVKNKLKQIVENKVEELVSKIKSERLAKIFKSYSAFFTFFTKAPAIIVVIQKDYNSILVKILKPIETPEYMDNITMVGRQNVSAAIQNVLLACQAEGLGACWMTGPMIAQDELRKEFDLKEDEKVAAFIPIGYLKGITTPHKFPDEKELNFKIV